MVEMAEVVFSNEEYPAVIIVDQWQYAVIKAALKSITPDKITNKLTDDYSACTQWDLNRLLEDLS